VGKTEPGFKRNAERLLRVNHPDPDIARRGQLLNVLLLGFLGATSAGFFTGLISGIADGWTRQDNILLLGSSVVGMIFVSALYLLNRSGKVRAAAITFLLGIVVLISFSDEPSQLIAGRSTIVYILPIVMSSVLLRPSASFVMVALSAGALFVLAVTNNFLLGPELSTMLVEIVIFFLVALVSWLSARSLEKALSDLRVINVELDRRVADRTRDLAEALIRVQLESSKTQAILESIADGVIVFDDRGKATLVNPAISRLLNLAPGQIVGYRIETLMAGMVGVADQQAVLEQLRGQESSTRLPGLRLQWGNKTLSASIAPIHVQQDTGSTGTVAVFRDVTREAELEHMKSMFVSTVSHELRTPLGAIMGYGEILQEQVHGPLNARQLGVVERLIANARRLLHLVNDLLDRARLEAGRLNLVITPFFPAALLEELLSVTGQLARAKNLELNISIASDLPPTLSGDSPRLMQILINLVTNAIKFTEHGSVTVKLERTDDTHWSLQVIDTGIGIPPDDQPHIFDAFRQVDNSATRKHGGAGLGLSIVKQLVTLMGGEITLNSQLGRGTTFSVILPIHLSAEEKHV
jgi:PAS domain S-box-containing protein